MAYLRVNQGFIVKGYLLDNTDGETYEISNYIDTILIRKSYIKDVFPEFVINLSTTEELRDRMRDDEVSVNLRISYYNIEDTFETHNQDNNEHTETGVYYEGTIRIYDKPYSTTVSKKEEDDNNTSSQAEAAPFIPYTLAGIPEDLISKNESCFNGVYKNCTPTDVIIHLLTSANLNNIYMEPTDNKTEYSNIIVPPLSLAQAVNFIDTNYHVYSQGINLFLDKDTYVYSPLTKNHESNLFECKIIDTDITTNNDVMLFPQYDDDTGNLKINYKNVPNFQTKKYISEHNLGTHAVMYYYDENFNLVHQSEDSNKGYTKTRYLWGPLYDTTITNLRKSESISLAFSAMNPDLIKPTTTFRLISDKYKEAEGDYSLGEVRIMFNTNDYNTYKNTIICGLIKK